jgi:hypothetical protein
MNKKPLGIQENIDRFGSANMYLSGALDLLCISPYAVLSLVEIGVLALASDEESLNIRIKLFEYKLEKFKQLCVENFGT